jgi:hypothetical protein
MFITKKYDMAAYVVVYILGLGLGKDFKLHVKKKL